jgi:tRNA(Ile)-lysidine synthase
MKRVKDFLKENWDQKSPLLLGYSGGPDSKALLYALLEAGCQTLHVAHVDHGWREESAREEEIVRKEIEHLKLPYFTTRLNGIAKEAIAREERFKFFKSLFEKNSYQALILGHQADDLAETVLKRIFEGTHLPFIGGMKPVSSMLEMTLWRPLLKISKKELINYLETKQLKPLFDPTNKDPAYLRARMRVETLPFLQKSFGKSILENLCILAERAAELNEYLDKKTSHLSSNEISCAGLERIELRYVLQKVAAREKVFLTRVVLEQLLDWVGDRKTRKVFIDGRWISSGKGQIVFENQTLTQN